MSGEYIVHFDHSPLPHLWDPVPVPVFLLEGRSEIFLKIYPKELRFEGILTSFCNFSLAPFSFFPLPYF